MVAWPPTWRTRALESAGIPVTTGTLAVIKAWKDSTPLSPVSNNPIGMPAGTLGAPRYLNTRYAIFPSISAFYQAFTSFARSSDGKRIVAAMLSENPYPETWRLISSLKWPGSLTETDYPAKLLDLTEQSYRDSVSATPPAGRKTSGQIGNNPQMHAAMVEQARSVAHAAQAFNDSTKAVQYLIRRHARNG